jgi:hypothetical protein
LSTGQLQHRRKGCSGLLISIFGHAGDSNLHINVMLQNDDELVPASARIRFRPINESEFEDVLSKLRESSGG